MINYKSQQKYITNQNCVNLGVKVEHLIKEILAYDEVREVNNSVLNHNMTTPDGSLKPDLFIDNSLVEIKYSAKGAVYFHNIHQMIQYFNFYKPNSMKLIVVSGVEGEFKVDIYNVGELVVEYEAYDKKSFKESNFYRFPEYLMTKRYENLSLVLQVALNSGLLKEDVRKLIRSI